MITKTVNDWYRKTAVTYTRALSDHKSAQCGARDASFTYF